MRGIALSVLLLAACGELPAASVDAGPDTRPTYSANMGSGCIPDPEDDFNGQKGGGDCPCIPFTAVPFGAASLGAYCDKQALRCCSWYALSGATYRNCGDGWACEGDRCP